MKYDYCEAVAHKISSGNRSMFDGNLPDLFSTNKNVMIITTKYNYAEFAKFQNNKLTLTDFFKMDAKTHSIFIYLLDELK